MEEERSLRHHSRFQERNTLINEAKIKELGFMFNEETLQKISDRVKHINQNINLHTHPMTTTASTMSTTLNHSSSSIFLPNENSSSSTIINSTLANSASAAINPYNKTEID